MRWRLAWTAEASLPPRESVLRAQGLPDGARLSPRIRALLAEASGLYLRLAEPRAVVESIERPAFAALYAAEGRNDRRSPLADIQPLADALALFVATLGARLSDAIGELFAQREPALGYMLDSVASEAADALTGAASQDFLAFLREAGAVGPEARVLPYSPGYCGWHVSGQRSLFTALRPEADTGVTLNESCLMQPLKSVSGVLVAAAGAAHQTLPGLRLL